MPYYSKESGYQVTAVLKAKANKIDGLKEMNCG
jgi:hypothetical protein